LYDFAQHGLIRGVSEYGVLTEYVGSAVEVKEDKKRKAAKAKEPTPKTPKQVYQLESLNDKTYELNTDPEYLARQIKSLNKKMKLLPAAKKVNRNELVEVSESFGASKYGRLEIGTLIERLENRSKYEEHKEFFDQYPYTTSALINEVLAEHKHLRTKRVEEFIPDMPDEAIDAMAAYKEHTKEICGKVPVFYIIADKKDFGEIDKKRDPILLAQSPFALGWQILGAWDEEMVYLGDL
jgi:hypothetical protein